jgi:DNA (cytosine-5)-methyltransferase 1
MVNTISLFSGCGGSDAGVIAANFKVILANDVLTYAKDVYVANHPETDYVLSDVTKIKNFPSAQLLVGCYPCQGFSQGGARDPSRKINTLYTEFARALNLIKPKAFIVENVSGMIRTNYRYLLDDQFRVFQEAGYKVKSQVLNAADYGVAQERKRIFIVGIRNDISVNYEFPARTYGDGAVNTKRTIHDVLNGMPLWPDGEYYDLGFHWYYMSRNRRRDWVETSKTIVANPRHMPLHPVSPLLVKISKDVWQFTHDLPARRFSYREAARIQGFAKDFVFPDTNASTLDMRYKVIGNAVPPPLFEAVAKALPNIWD